MACALLVSCNAKCWFAGAVCILVKTILGQSVETLWVAQMISYQMILEHIPGQKQDGARWLMGLLSSQLEARSKGGVTGTHSPSLKDVLGGADLASRRTQSSLSDRESPCKKRTITWAKILF
jgi:hypothetical protein